jgi:DNA-binding HxlR family transcriptional regulator
MMRRDTGYNIIPSGTYAKNIYAIYYNTISVPSKNIASVLNNESNMRILGWLKAKPYYPRELAAAMDVSEQFIVRRLKAMEEHGIVEGKWENEGGHRVKRYYPQDIILQIGDEGLEVTSDYDPKISPDKKWKHEECAY